MIENIISRIDLIIDPGISIEIKDSFRDEKAVLDFKLSVKDKKYFVEVKLHDCTAQIVSRLFMSVISFIQYRHMTYYQRKLLDKSIVYELVTATENMEGFYCQIIFK